MNSCGSTSIGTKLKIPKSSDENKDSVIIEQQDDEDLEDNEILKDYVSDIIKVPKTTLFICPKNSSNYSADHSFSRFKPRYHYY